VLSVLLSSFVSIRVHSWTDSSSAYNAAMSLKHVDIGSAFRLLAERRIEDAMKEGKFDNNPLAGKDVAFDPMPAHEDARMTWWALRILKQNDVTPDEVRWRKTIDHLKERLEQVTDVAKIAPLVNQINDLIRKLNTLGTNAIALAVAPVAVESEIEKFIARQRRQRQGG
jgi:hypothetical protein